MLKVRQIKITCFLVADTGEKSIRFGTTVTPSAEKPQQSRKISTFLADRFLNLENVSTTYREINSLSNHLLSDLAGFLWIPSVTSPAKAALPISEITRRCVDPITFILST